MGALNRSRIVENSMEHEIEIGFMEWFARLVWRELKVWHGVWGAGFRG